MSCKLTLERPYSAYVRNDKVIPVEKLQTMCATPGRMTNLSHLQRREFQLEMHSDFEQTYSLLQDRKKECQREHTFSKQDNHSLLSLKVWKDRLNSMGREVNSCCFKTKVRLTKDYWAEAQRKIISVLRNVVRLTHLTEIESTTY